MWLRESRLNQFLFIVNKLGGGGDLQLPKCTRCQPNNSPLFGSFSKLVNFSINPNLAGSGLHF